MERENYLEDLKQRKPKKYVGIYKYECQYNLDSKQPQTNFLMMIARTFFSKY